MLSWKFDHFQFWCCAVVLLCVCVCFCIVVGFFLLLFSFWLSWASRRFTRLGCMGRCVFVALNDFLSFKALRFRVVALLWLFLFLLLFFFISFSFFGRTFTLLFFERIICCCRLFEIRMEYKSMPVENDFSLKGGVSIRKCSKWLSKWAKGRGKKQRDRESERTLDTTPENESGRKTNRWKWVNDTDKVNS